jgi:catalase
VIDGFEEVNGVHPGFRRNHAKGVCIGGAFDSKGQGGRLSKGAVFRPGQVPVIGRLSLAGGEPYMADGPAAPTWPMARQQCAPWGSPSARPMARNGGWP